MYLSFKFNRMEILFLLLGMALGAVVIYFFLKSKTARVEKSFLAEKLEIDKQKTVAEERVQFLLSERSGLETEVKELRQNNEGKGQRLARAEEEFRNLREKLQMQKQEMEELQKKFTTEFENVANRILKKNSAEFTETNQKNINDILSPLKEKIQLFEKKVEETYEKGLKDQTDLKAELKKLHDLNMRISDEANNLTKALKGDVKKQGNWGEVILERILERSGLTEGREYEKQESVMSEDGKRIQPDIVIHLPDNKHIIVDSKVSLVAYERLVNATDEKQKETFVKEHLLSLRTHIMGLSEKHYQNSPNFNSPDFVLLFVPIEASFSVAIQEDQELFSYAWDNKVVIVSPSTLLATLRTIASIWQQENQTRNAIEIARQGGALYDKFVNFVSDLERVGTSLDATRKNYDAAFNKLKDGRGNLIRSAEKLKELGAKASKKLPQALKEE